jgi:hypothetical protein
MNRLIASLILAIAVASPAHAWGKTGHRVVGAVAQTYLSQTADSAVKDILGPTTCAPTRITSGARKPILGIM